jgi:surfactin synthase thioesterase subunit
MIVLIPARAQAPGEAGTTAAVPEPVGARVDALERELADRPLPERLVLVGHGTGAYVAVELARRLEQRGSGPVHAVVVAAQVPPRPAHDGRIDDADPPADVYEFDYAEPIEAPLHVWAASHDPSAPPGEAMLGWARCTDGPTAFRVFEGSHDFLFAGNDAVAARLRLLASPRAEVLHA